jgi:heptosyltransferase I
MTTNPPSKPTTICIFRLSAIGDATHVVPVVKTLQACFPECQITWIIGKLEYKLLKGLPGVEFIVFDKAAGWQGIKALRKTLSGQVFDVLLQMQLSFRANIVSRFIKAKRRIGYDKTRGKEGHGWVINERIEYLKDCHVLDGFMQFAQHLGCKTPVYDWQIPVSEEDQLLAHNVINKNTINVVISPCSSHDLRNWSVEKYSQLSDWLVSEYDAQVILTAGPSAKEQAFVAKIEKLSTQKVTNIAGKDTLKQLLCLLKNANLVISPDSGPLHMSGSVGTPVIGLLAASNYRRSGSYQFPELTVDKYSEACMKYLNKKVSEVKWGAKTEFPGAMDLIELKDVQSTVKTVLTKRT